MPHILRNMLISALLMLATLLISRGKRPMPRLGSTYGAGILLLTVCMAVVFSLTGISPLSGFHTDISLDRINLVPFNGMVKVASNGLGGYALTNLLGNLLMFMPLGFFAGLLCPALRGPFRAWLAGLAVSLFIEGTQLFLNRGTDVDDLILNSLGALAGYGLYAVFRRLFPALTGKADAEHCADKTMLFWLCSVLPYVAIILCGSYDRYLYLG